FHGQHHSEVGHGHVMAVDRIFCVRRRCFAQMRDQLMPKEIEVDPGLGAAALGTPKQSAIKLSGGGDVIDRYRQMKRIKRMMIGRHDRSCTLSPARLKTDPASVDCPSQFATEVEGTG